MTNTASLLTKQALTDEDRQRIQELYASGSTGMPQSTVRGALRGSMLGAAALGVPVGVGTFGLGHWLMKGLRVPSPYKQIGYGASATLAAIMALRAAKHGIIPGAVASGVYGAIQPSGAKKELYDIAKGYDPELQSRREKSLARKALKDILDYQKNY